jgi:nucleoside-diphosphate-sugar epimerase
MNSNEVAKVFDPLNRSVIYIDDVIDSIIEISRQWREFYPSVINMAGPHLISRKDIANSISEMFPGSLDYKVVTPDKVFYQARPQVINMKSLYIKKLLKRDTMSVQQALKNEYKIGGLK